MLTTVCIAQSNDMKSDAYKNLLRTGREMRDLMAYARTYLKEDGSAAVLHGYASMALDVATHPELVSYLNEWIIMSERAWNEWGTVENPLTECEL